MCYLGKRPDIQSKRYLYMNSDKNPFSALYCYEDGYCCLASVHDLYVPTSKVCIVLYFEYILI